MLSNARQSSGVGLERSCDDSDGNWLRSFGPEHGVEFFEAWFQRSGYRKHRHDTYAISQTTRGVLAFDYRGSGEVSIPGRVVVLHPDEVHDGHAGTDTGFGYRQLYIEPILIFEAVRVLRGRSAALPFVRNPVVVNAKLSNAVTEAFDGGREPLAIDSLVLQLAEGLLESDESSTHVPLPRHLDLAAIQRARQFLDAEKTRVVRSEELEAVTGLTRYDLSRQFRQMCGTSPYRYLLMRRLDFAREQMAQQRSLADVAFDAGFADQAHFTRAFKAAYGLTPSQYRALQ